MPRDYAKREVTCLDEKFAVQEATNKLGNSLKQTVFRQCARVEKRMLAMDMRVDKLVWMTLGRIPAAASES
eukprot:5221967-Karenia_brevis.AAC.1